MIALLKKDWRTYRSAVVGSIIVMGCIYAVGTWAYFIVSHQAPEELPQVMLGTGAYGLVITPVLAAVFGGLSFAAERRDHSAEFLAMLPVNRTQIVWSKIVVAVAWLLGMVLLNLAIIAVALTSMPNWEQIVVGRNIGEAISVFVVGLSVTVMLFGVAWCLSSFMTSPAISASISIGVMGASLTAIATTFERPLAHEGLMNLVESLWAMFVGITTFMIGTKHYLRRIEP